MPKNKDDLYNLIKNEAMHDDRVYSLMDGRKSGLHFNARKIFCHPRGMDWATERMAKLVKPGGRLVYAVCSLQPEEGEAQLAAIAALGLRPAPVRAEEMPGLPDGAVTAAGALRTRPDLWAERGGMDGFFVVRFVSAGGHGAAA
jgi:hypothetical protein